MKSGASDPFAEEASEDEPEARGQGEDESAVEEGAKSVESVEPVEESTKEEEEEQEEQKEKGEEAEAEEAEAEEGVELDTDEIDRSDIPWVLRRDAVKDDRPHVHQLFVRDDTDGRARRAESRLEERLGRDVYRLDAREAMYLVGMRHLNEVVEVLEEWGYNL